MRLGNVTALVVDDDPAATECMTGVLEDGCHVRTRAVRSLHAAHAALRRHPADLILTELRLPDASGLSAVRSLRATSYAPIVVVTAHGSEELAADATRLGAHAYLAKRPGYGTVLANLIEDLLGSDTLRRIDAALDLDGADGTPPTIPSAIVAESREMRRVLLLAGRAARSRVTALIEGETGTGKELVARAIHALGPNPSAPFRVQNCGALPETLLEAELFGHVRGAFTSAERDRPGLFLDARDGTVFLDEIGDAPPGLQAKLLRVVQEGEVKPVGADRPRRNRARIVAATHRSLEREVERGRFRADLYYRLCVLPIQVPPLRERPEDVAPIAVHFLDRLRDEEGRDVGGFTVDALAALRAHRWPGNVRELEHEVHRLVLTHPAGAPIDVHALAPRIRRAEDAAGGEPLERILRRVELAVLRDRIRHAPSKAAAARSLGITREALYWKLRRLENAGDEGA